MNYIIFLKKMNIEKWLYPKPRTNWKLSDHKNEIIWIPVYGGKGKVHLGGSQEKSYYLSSLASNDDEHMPDEGTISSKIKQYSSRNFGSDNDFTNSQDTSITNDSKVNEAVQKYQTSLGIHYSPFSSDMNNSNPISPQTMYSGSKKNQIPPMHPLLQSTLSLQKSSLFPRLPQDSQDPDQTTVNPCSPITRRIPCLFLQQNEYQEKVLIYFHSNAEDIHLCRPFCEHLMVQLNVCVLAMEYAGYGYYTGQETTEESICSDAEAVFDFLTKQTGIESSRPPSQRKCLRAR